MKKVGVRVKVLLIVGGLITLLGLSVLPGNPPQQAAAALDVEPRRKAEIIIQSSKVGANLTDFPVLLTKDTIPTEACDADGTSPAQNGGGDIRFTSDENGNNQLALQVVSFATANDPANCVIEMYVKVPAVSSTANTSIWMWYDTETTASQPAVNSTYGSQNVWTNSYKGVWHLNESSGTTRGDSTANANNLADNNTVASGSGKWGTAADFEEDYSQFLSITDGSQTGLDITGALSVGFWFKPESDEGQLMSRYNETGSQVPYWIQSIPGGKLRFGVNDGTTSSYFDSTTALTNGQWYYIAATYDPGVKMEIYINGVSDAVKTDSVVSSILNSTADFRLSSGASSGANHFFADGLMQEGRISSALRPAGWISTEYNNQNDPGTFAIEQAPQVGSTAPASATAIKSLDKSITSKATLETDTDFVFALKANTKYVISGGIFATSTSGQPDIRIGFKVPIGATMDIGYLAQGGNTRTAELLETSDGSSAEIAIPANVNTIIQPFGSVVTGSTADNLTFKWAQFTSNATATTVKQGSFITVTEATQ